MPDSAPIRIASLETREEALACARLMSSSEPWITLERDEEQSLSIVTSPDREVYLARAGSELAGFVVLVMSGALVGYIQSIAVVPERRGQGLGTALVEFAEKRIFSQSPNSFINASSFNPGARRLYERLGYETVGEFKDYIVPGHSEVLLRKTLGPIKGYRPPAGY